MLPVSIDSRAAKLAATLAAGLLVAAGGLAQSPRRGTPEFVLPAGSHALDELVERVGQMRGRAIRVEPDVREHLHSRSLRIARELRLPTDGFDDLVATLLLQQGIALVPEQSKDPSPNGLEAIRLDQRAGDLPLVATEVDAGAVLQRPDRADCVRTRLDTGALEPSHCSNMLRPVFAMAFDAWPLLLEIDGDALVATGTRDQVAFALRLLAAANGEGDAVHDVPAWADADTTRAWPGGESTLDALAALAGRALDVTLVQPLEDEPTETTLDLGEPADLAPGAWFARFSRALDEAHCALSPLSLRHRVFELVPRTAKKRAHIATWRSLFLTPDGVLGSDDLLPVVTTFATEGEGNAAMNRLRPMVGRNSRMTVGSLGTGRMLLIGPRDEVAAAIRVLRGE